VTVGLVQCVHSSLNSKIVYTLVQVAASQVSNSLQKVQLAQCPSKAVAGGVRVGSDHHGLLMSVIVDLEQPTIFNVLLFDCTLDKDLFGF